MRTGKIQFNLLGIPGLRVNWPFKIAENFEELTDQQLAWWAEHVWQHIHEHFVSAPDDDSENVDELQLRDPNSFFMLNLAMIKAFSNIPFWLFSTLDDESQRNMIFHWKLASWAYNTSFAPKENPVQLMASGRLYGPLVIDDLSGWEFAYADIFYTRYRKGQDEKDLNKFIAQLFRAKRKNASIEDPEVEMDIREKYSHRTDELRMPLVERVPIGQKLLVLYWYEKWRNDLPKYHPHLFSSSNEKKSKKDGSWLPTFMTISQGIYNFEKVKQTKAVLLMVELNRLCKEQKDMERRMEEAKNKRS